MELLVLLLIPLVVGGGAFYLFHTRITWKEFLLMELLSVVGIVALFLGARWGSMSDVEHWNGRITGKTSGTQSCCHCHTICDKTDKSGSCVSSHTECDHFHDYWWTLSVSTGDDLTEDCDGWGFTPSWWAGAYIGEPASVEHRYQNYLKADPESLWIHQTAHKQFLSKVPDTYPTVVDRYKADKVVAQGLPKPNGWEFQLREINADTGALKQVDLTIFLTRSEDPAFADAVEEKWLFGPKNALIVVLGVPDGQTIAWARVVTISKVEELKIDVRDTLQGRALRDPEILPDLRRIVVQKFHRTPMEEFSYLASAATPTGWWRVMMYLGAFALSIGLSIWMHRKDVFGDEWRLRRF